MPANKINLPLRAVAAKIITSVLVDQKSLTSAFILTTDHLLPEKEISLLKELCFGTIRWYHRLHYIAQQFIKIPLKTKDQDIYALILMGLYQLLYLRIAQHAAVSETVAAAYALKKAWAAKLINGVLRQYIRNADSLSANINQNSVAQFSHAAWFIEKVQSAWPEQWQTILEANNERPPMSCRINAQHFSRDEYLQLLESNHIAAKTIEFTSHGLILDKPCDAHLLPEFAAGSISVQDGAAQLAAQLLELKPGQRVLDACAAPGGKTMHILELQPELEKLVAIDVDEQRVLQIEENLTRLQITFNSPSSTEGTFSRKREKEKKVECDALSHNHYNEENGECGAISGKHYNKKNDDGGAISVEWEKEINIELIIGDASAPDTWWDKQLFDRILCDAPCSATGVIRRHPDIKILRREADIEQLVTQQWQLLNALWSLLKPGGVLLYCTCSILPIENSQLLQRFLSIHTDAQHKIIPVDWGIAQPIGRQILTGMHNMDGFYFAKITKYPIN